MRTCVGAIGLVASIPLTTAVAALLAVQGRAVEDEDHDRDRHGGTEAKPGLRDRLAQLRSADTVPDLRADAPQQPRQTPTAGDHEGHPPPDGDAGRLRR